MCEAAERYGQPNLSAGQQARDMAAQRLELQNALNSREHEFVGTSLIKSQLF